MVPYADLSEEAKSLDRATIQVVYDAIRQAMAAKSRHQLAQCAD